MAASSRRAMSCRLGSGRAGRPVAAFVAPGWGIGAPSSRRASTGLPARPVSPASTSMARPAARWSSPRDRVRERVWLAWKSRRYLRPDQSTQEFLLRAPLQIVLDLLQIELFGDQCETIIGFTEYRYPRYRTSKVHRFIAEQLERVERGEIDRLMLRLPPRHGKSELASRNFPAYCIGRKPWRQFIAASATADLAREFGREVRNIIGTEAYQAVYSTGSPRTARPPTSGTPARAAAGIRSASAATSWAAARTLRSSTIPSARWPTPARRRCARTCGTGTTARSTTAWSLTADRRSSAIGCMRTISRGGSRRGCGQATSTLISGPSSSCRRSGPTRSASAARQAKRYGLSISACRGSSVSGSTAWPGTGRRFISNGRRLKRASCSRWSG